MRCKTFLVPAAIVAFSLPGFATLSSHLGPNGFHFTNDPVSWKLLCKQGDLMQFSMATDQDMLVVEAYAGVQYTLIRRSAGQEQPGKAAFLFTKGEDPEADARAEAIFKQHADAFLASVGRNSAQAREVFQEVMQHATAGFAAAPKLPSLNEEQVHARAGAAAVGQYWQATQDRMGLGTLVQLNQLLEAYPGFEGEGPDALDQVLSYAWKEIGPTWVNLGRIAPMDETDLAEGKAQARHAPRLAAGADADTAFDPALLPAPRNDENLPPAAPSAGAASEADASSPSRKRPRTGSQAPRNLERPTKAPRTEAQRFAGQTDTRKPLAESKVSKPNQ